MNTNAAIDHLVERARIEIVELGVVVPRAVVGQHVMQLALPPLPTGEDERALWWLREAMQQRRRIATAVAAVGAPDGTTAVMSYMHLAGGARIYVCISALTLGESGRHITSRTMQIHVADDGTKTLGPLMGSQPMSN